MKLKEKLAEEFQPDWNCLESLHFGCITREAYLAGFEAAKKLALKLSKDYAHVSVCNKSELVDCFAACELVYDLKKLGESDV